MTDTNKQSDAVVIKSFFLQGMTAKEAIVEIQRLTLEERAQLAEGIRNNTLTY